MPLSATHSATLHLNKLLKYYEISNAINAGNHMVVDGIKYKDTFFYKPEFFIKLRLGHVYGLYQFYYDGQDWTHIWHDAASYASFYDNPDIISKFGNI